MNNFNDDKNISKHIVRRLPRYFRFLGELSEKGVERISSTDLSKLMNVTASQIRQDLNKFGGFGQQGYGYNVNHLRREIGRILGIDVPHKVIMIGAGNLCSAIMHYRSFPRYGFNIVAAECLVVDSLNCCGNRNMLDIGVVFKHTAADGGISDLKHRECALGVRGAFLQIRRHIRRNRHGFVLVAFEIAAADQNAPRNFSCIIFIQQRGVPGRMLADGKNIKAVWSIGPRLSVFQLLFGIDMIYEFFVKDIRVISVILKFHALDVAVN